jgi:hypothetical protein
LGLFITFDEGSKVAIDREQLMKIRTDCRNGKVGSPARLKCGNTVNDSAHFGEMKTASRSDEWLSGGR